MGVRGRQTHGEHSHWVAVLLLAAGVVQVVVEGLAATAQAPAPCSQWVVGVQVSQVETVEGVLPSSARTPLGRVCSTLRRSWQHLHPLPLCVWEEGQTPAAKQGQEEEAQGEGRHCKGL
jgi:hypothetical protein